MVTGNQILPPLLPRACCVLLLLLWFLFDFCRLSLCQRLAWGITLRSSQSLARAFSCACALYIQVLLKCPSPYCVAPKTDSKRTMKGRNTGFWPFKSPRSVRGKRFATMWAGATTMVTALLSTPLWSEAETHDENTNPLYLEDRILFGHPGSCKQL